MLSLCCPPRPPERQQQSAAAEPRMSACPVHDVKALKMEASSGCPMHTHKAASVAHNWWPNQLNLKPLACAPPASLHKASYAADFATLDLEALKADVMAAMTDSQEWWPADYGHYGPFFVRMAWHSAGTYRVFDGRGGGGKGNLRFAPLNSWPDNGNLDKARRLLWPIKRKYGRKVSWGDLMLFTGNCAIESMGLEPFGFGFGREDAWEPEEDVYWGQEKSWLAAERGGLGDKLERPLGAVQMGLIYVNPEGPGGNPDPLLAAQDIRETFARMAMNDEETVALIAGGHTFGKAHGAAPPSEHVGPAPEGAPVEEQGFGWKSSFGSGKGKDAITSGLEGAWTATPTKWDNGYFEYLFKYDWVKSTSPGGATQWVPQEASKDPAVAALVPDAHDPTKKHAPIMFTTDLALLLDPSYGPISRRFFENPQDFEDAFRRAWYKLTHRDMGPASRYLGPYVPEPQLWQDPIPPPPAVLIGAAEVEELKAAVLSTGLGVGPLVKCAWASASSFRTTDKRGGANGARVALQPMRDWPANDPTELKETLAKLQEVRAAFNSQGGPAMVSLADLIVLAGCAAVEAGAKAAGHAQVAVPFTPGRGDATQEQTDEESFAFLEPAADGFRNYLGPTARGSAEANLVDRAHLLELSCPEMCCLVAGLRALGATHSSMSAHPNGLVHEPGKLSNAFFKRLLDMAVAWAPVQANTAAGGPALYEAKSPLAEGVEEEKCLASRVDLVFGSNSQLRAVAEAYASDDAAEGFVMDFVAAWDKVMNLDRFDLK
mmetsp:Transcript_13016/g.30723  ORF Transcript_13016/g.30723 Transcript_13016/m.30723 type:complete len:773 (-) Transcript_13016:334-2652(-)